MWVVSSIKTVAMIFLLGFICGFICFAFATRNPAAPPHAAGEWCAAFNCDFTK